MLIINPVGTAGLSTEGQRSDEYFINVTSIAVNNNSSPSTRTASLAPR